MKTTKMLAVLVLALGLIASVANADFTFGTPTNLGPVVNTSSREAHPSISASGLSLYFDSRWPGGYGDTDIWVSTRATTDDDWGTPMNLGATVNSSAGDISPSISADSLSLFFDSSRPGVGGGRDLWVTTRASTDDDWGTPVNLGLTVNSLAVDSCPSISTDGLSLFFGSPRPGGLGLKDIWVTTRPSTDDDWGTPVNPTVNSSSNECCPSISADGLALFFESMRTGGYGKGDIYVSSRATKGDPWGVAVNLGPLVNSSAQDWSPEVSSDGSTLFFMSKRPGGFGNFDIWQASIEPVVDLNGDGIVDSVDMCIMVDHWGENYSLCDIGPMPWGDGIVDVQDLIVLAEHLFEEFPPVEPEKVHVDEKDDGSEVELEQGQILVVTLESNPTTGYRWEQVENQESILEQMGEAEFKPSEKGEPPLVGAGGWEIFRFKAISAGQTSLKLVYHRPWEEGVEPLKTFSIQVVVR